MTKKTVVQMVADIATLVAEALLEAEAFESKGNKSAGGRVRKALQSIRGLAKDARKLVTEIKTGMKSKDKKSDNAKDKKKKKKE